LSDDGAAENQEDAGYRTYMQPSPAPQAGEPPPQPAAEPPPQPPPEPASEPVSSDDDDPEEAAVYKTYVQPLRVPSPRVEATPPAPEPENEPIAAASPPPLPQEAPPQLASPPSRAPEAPPPVAAPRSAWADFKNFEFRKPGHTSGRRRLLKRAATAVVVAVALALAYPLVNPFGSSSASSLTQYLQRFRPIALRADQDRRSVQSAVNAVRSNPKSRTGGARRLLSANNDREVLIQRLAGLGPAPGVARALPGRLTRLLRIQVETGRVWQRWMQHRPFVYLKHDPATRNRVQGLLRSQQSSKGSFTQLYARLMRAANLPLVNPTGA
jgi:hypothetical protein